jgi:Predicted membrane protein (DUF2142)
VTVTRSPFRVRWVVLGLLLIEIGWVLAVPPFRGVDEWDHAYRASAVAHGQWIAPPTEATRGTGAIVHVEPDIVAAAQPECQRLPYTGDPECVGTQVGEHVEIASGAGRYHPLFYAIVGTPTLLFEGVDALYAMRAVATLLCLAMLAMGFHALRSWDEPLVAVAMLCALTPMVLYSSSIVAPNGLEMVSGMALWAALGAMARPERPPESLHIVTAVVATALLVSLRSLGPLWALLVVATALLAWPRLAGRLWALLRTRQGVVGALVLTAAAAGSLAWIKVQDALVIGRQEVVVEIPATEAVLISALRIPQWIFQWMGAFPYRAQAAPAVVYAALLPLLVYLLFVAIRHTGGRYRTAVLTVLIGSLVIPLGITIATLEQYGTSWQGRYALPYLLGLGVLFGTPLADRLGSKGRRIFPTVVFPLLAVGHTASVAGVLLRERRDSPQSGTAAWSLAPPAAFLIVCVVLGVAVALLPLASALTRNRGTR